MQGANIFYFHFPYGIDIDACSYTYVCQQKRAKYVTDLSTNITPTNLLAAPTYFEESPDK